MKSRALPDIEIGAEPKIDRGRMNPVTMAGIYKIWSLKSKVVVVCRLKQKRIEKTTNKPKIQLIEKRSKRYVSTTPIRDACACE